MSRIDELRDLIRFYEEQIEEDHGESGSDYEVELATAIDELNTLLKNKT